MRVFTVAVAICDVPWRYVACLTLHNDFNDVLIWRGCLGHASHRHAWNLIDMQERTAKILSFHWPSGRFTAAFGMRVQRWDMPDRSHCNPPFFSPNLSDGRKFCTPNPHWERLEWLNTLPNAGWIKPQESQIRRVSGPLASSSGRMYEVQYKNRSSSKWAGTGHRVAGAHVGMARNARPMLSPKFGWREWLMVVRVRQLDPKKHQNTMANVDQFCGQIGPPWCPISWRRRYEMTVIQDALIEGGREQAGALWGGRGKGEGTGWDGAGCKHRLRLLSTGWLINTGPLLGSPHWLIMLNNSKMEKMPNQKKAKVLLISPRWEREREIEREKNGKGLWWRK